MLRCVPHLVQQGADGPRILSGQWPDTPHYGPLREFQSGSSRLSCAWDMRYWATARRWSEATNSGDLGLGYIGQHMVWSRDQQRKPHLYQGELQLLLTGNDEFGYKALYALGIEDVNTYLARSVLVMAKSIEEATGWA